MMTAITILEALRPTTTRIRLFERPCWMPGPAHSKASALSEGAGKGRSAKSGPWPLFGDGRRNQ